MQLSRLINAMSEPAVYGHGVDRVEVIHTHASVVFLAGPYAYKIKKPVNFGFLDYSTLSQRRLMCEQELTLNRRLALDVYLRVVPVTIRGGGLVELDGNGDVVDYAVQMRRLPETSTLRHRLHANGLDSRTLGRVAGRIAAFHLDARRGPDVARWAAFERVRVNARDNFEALRAHVPAVTSARWLERLARASEDEVTRMRRLIEARVIANAPCDGHGDLRLEHVYLLPPDNEIVIVDCIEFSPAFRCGDPVADIAFLAMDLQAHGAWGGAQELLFAYFAASGDLEGEPLVPFYLSYRSMVRAKVRAFQSIAPELPDDTREQALRLARAHVQTAAVALLPPRERPCIVLVAGLPGTGKSVLSNGLAKAGNFTWLRADSIRKELAGLAPDTDQHGPVREGIYTPEWNDRTYDTCAQRAREHLAQGRRVIIDASFKEERRRLQMLAAAREAGVPLRMLVCTADPEVVHNRLDERHGDPSDADWGIYEHVRRTWEPFGPRTQPVAGEVDCSGSDPDVPLRDAMAMLYVQGLVDGPESPSRSYGGWPRLAV